MATARYLLLKLTQAQRKAIVELFNQNSQLIKGTVLERIYAEWFVVQSDLMPTQADKTLQAFVTPSSLNDDSAWAPLLKSEPNFQRVLQYAGEPRKTSSGHNTQIWSVYFRTIKSGSEQDRKMGQRLLELDPRENFFLADEFKDFRTVWPELTTQQRAEVLQLGLEDKNQIQWPSDVGLFLSKLRSEWIGGNLNREGLKTIMGDINFKYLPNNIKTDLQTVLKSCEPLEKYLTNLNSARLTIERLQKALILQQKEIQMLSHRTWSYPLAVNFMKQEIFQHCTKLLTLSHHLESQETAAQVQPVLEQWMQEVHL